MTISADNSRQAFFNYIYTFCYFKFLGLYMDYVINSNYGMLDM